MKYVKVSNKDTRNFKWVSENQMKGNRDKYHLLMSNDKSSEIHVPRRHRT